MALRGSGSRSSLTLEELTWFSQCSTFAETTLRASSPIPIPPKRSTSPEIIPVGINDSLTLLRTKGLSRRNYQKSTKSSRAKASPTSAFPESSSFLYNVTPPAPVIPSSPVGTSSAPATPVTCSLSTKQPRNPRVAPSRRIPSSPSSSSCQDDSLPTSRPPPSPRQFSKHPEWIYRRPKLSSSSSSCHTATNEPPRPRAPLPSFSSGPRGNEPGYSPSYDGGFGREFKQPPSPPSSFWAPRRKRYQSDDQAPGPQWDNFDRMPLRPPPKFSFSNHSTSKISSQQSCRSDSTSTSNSSSSSESSRPHTPPLQHYSSPPEDIVMNSDPYPRSILTRTSSTSTQKYAPSIMVAHGRQRSGSCSKSVKFVEAPTVHYASVDWDWVIPDEEDTDVDDSESDAEAEEEEEVGSFPSPILGKFSERAVDNRSVDTIDSIRTNASATSSRRTRSLKRLVGLKREASSRRRPAEASSQKASISGPFALGTLPAAAPSPPFVVPHAVKGTSVSLRSAPSCDSFRSVKSSGGRSILSVKSLRSLPGSLKTSAQGLKDWFTGRRVTVD